MFIYVVVVHIEKRKVFKIIYSYLSWSVLCREQTCRNFDEIAGLCKEQNALVHYIDFTKCARTTMQVHTRNKRFI